MCYRAAWMQDAGFMDKGISGSDFVAVGRCIRSETGRVFLKVFQG